MSAADIHIRARDFAVKAHGDQEYGEGVPYVVHLDAVAALVFPYGRELQAVAYLHDVLEDTGTTSRELVAAFGMDVAGAVVGCSDPPGGNRAQRKREANLLLGSLLESSRALIVKPADRLANVRACAGDHPHPRPDLLEMYRAEYPEFRAAAWRPGLCPGFWEELAELLEVDG